MKLRGWIFFIGLIGVVPAMAQSFSLPADFWLTPRSGASVRTEPQLQQIVKTYLKSDKTRIRVLHQKRDESIAQAEELRGWLIALGVDAARIELSDEITVDVIKLEIMETR